VRRRPDAPALAVLPVDVIAVVVAHLLAVASFHAAFSGTAFFVAGAAGTLAATAYWMLAFRASVPTWTRLVGAVAVFAIVGPIATVRGDGLHGFLPTAGAVASVFSASVHGWRTLVTTLPPVGDLGHVLVVPYLCGFVGASASLLLLRASRAAFLAAVPPIVILGAGVLVGTDRPGSLYLEGGLLLAAVLVWASSLARRARLVIGTVRHVRGRGLVASVALLAVVVLGAGAVGSHVPFVHPSSRYVLRDRVQPPFDPTQYPSPLAGYRKYRVAKTKSAALLTVSGVTTKTRLRIAVMDDYDGLVWRVADNGDLDAFRRAGSSLPDTKSGTVEDLKVTIRGLKGVWLPTVGQPLSITFTGRNAGQLTSGLRYNVAQSTAAEPGGLRPGDQFTLRTTVDPGQPNVDGMAIAPQPSTSSPAIFTTFADKAGALTKGGSDAGSQAAAIAAAFRQGYYDDGPTQNTPPGHFLARIDAFLREQNPVGDSEQYAAAAAILLRARQIPARVVLGLTLVPRRQEYRNGDVQAWIEIPVAGKGWVAYDVTPGIDRRPQPQPQPKQRVPGPPPPAQPPHGALSANSGAVGSAESKSKNASPTTNPRPHHGGGFPFVVIAIAAIPVVLFGVPVLLILGLKRRRRIRRRRAPTPAQQISGGWDEVVDHLRDLGRPVPPAATRRELAITSMSDGLGDFAARVDASVFGARNPSTADARALWNESVATCRRLVQQAGRLDRLRCALSVSSLRPER
jgi:Transglutaminase-like superfamily/TgpA N-terminal domain